eukprot:5717787-Prymnesium_polylepis.1
MEGGSGRCGKGFIQGARVGGCSVVRRRTVWRARNLGRLPTQDHRRRRRLPERSPGGATAAGGN